MRLQAPHLPAPHFPTSAAAAAGRLAAGLCLSVALTVGPLPALPALAEDDPTIVKYKFPPIDRTNKNRCKFSGSAMGQANAARDSLYDLRECKLEGTSAAGFDISGALMADGDFSKVDFKESQLSKVYAQNAIFDGADFTNGVVDRAFFKGASFQGAIFSNCVLSGSNFEDANLENSDFTDAYLGDFDQRKICKNKSLKGENPSTGAPTRESAGCANRG